MQLSQNKLTLSIWEVSHNSAQRGSIGGGGEKEFPQPGGSSQLLILATYAANIKFNRITQSSKSIPKPRLRQCNVTGRRIKFSQIQIHNETYTEGCRELFVELAASNLS